MQSSGVPPSYDAFAAWYHSTASMSQPAAATSSYSAYGTAPATVGTNSGGYPTYSHQPYAPYSAATAAVGRHPYVRSTPYQPPPPPMPPSGVGTSSSASSSQAGSFGYHAVPPPPSLVASSSSASSSSAAYRPNYASIAAGRPPMSSARQPTRPHSFQQPAMAFSTAVAAAPTTPAMPAASTVASATPAAANLPAPTQTAAFTPPSKRDWPESLKIFVQKALAQAKNDDDEAFTKQKLNSLLSQTFQNGKFYTHLWNLEKTPLESRHEEQERELQRLQAQKQTKSGKKGKHSSNKQESASAAVAAAAAMATKLAAAAKANIADANTPPADSPAISTPKRKRGGIPEADEGDVFKLQKRAKRFDQDTRNTTTLGSRSGDTIDEEWAHEAIVGTNTELEKRYFRLTSAPNPKDVRPLHILKQTLELLKKKWSQDGDYTYICDQFKSMRQDLTIQHIRNDFTVQVYELHARIALEKGDLGEFNQCQTQLKILYDDGVSGCRNEFTAYRLLYFLLARARSDINKMLTELTPEDKKAPEVAHALQVRAAIAQSDYRRVCMLYTTAPNMGAYVMDHYVERERVLGLVAICKAYRPDLSVEYIQTQMRFDTIADAQRFLDLCGCSFTDASKTTLDTKTSLPTVLAKAAEYTKVDIRGQL